MKNKEKYAKEILEIACNGDSIALKNNKLTCCRCSDCSECLFNGSDCCRKQVKKWSESEYIEEPVISKRDKAFLEYIDGKFKYIVRDSVGELYAYSAKPCKNLGIWAPQAGVGFQLDFNFSVDFKVVKWSDEEPWLIEDLKKLEVVDEYE